ncbi:MAG: flagellar basal body P-ring protein FlgI, partial [Parvularculaceae bacterium]|nr:flagellar basal body P-ring protein FlgI [Parvularculaceae bacterium]
KAGDGAIYAVAQGPVLASGLAAKAPGASVTFGAPTAGSIPQGARVEREVDFDFGSVNRIRLALKSPDVTTAIRIEEAINSALGPGAAVVTDPGTIDIAASGEGRSPMRIIAAIENLRVEAEQRARVVIDQKSGTVVMGADVRISRFAVTQGNLTITVRESAYVSQPNPFSRNGDTIVVPNADVAIDAGGEAKIGVVDESVSFADLVHGLNALGVGPRELIDILTAIKASGALHADIVLL